MFMNQSSNACDDLDHMEDILYMVAQPIAACCARLAGTPTGVDVFGAGFGFVHD
jgi:hypothetical protein